MLRLVESLDRVEKASSMRWYGHVLRREQCFIEGSAFRIAWSHRKGTTETNVEKTSTKGNA